MALCRLDDIPEGAARGFSLGEGTDRLDVLVARRGGRAFAYVNSCPHIGTPLDWTPDRFMSADGAHLQCATHGALFRVEDGTCIAGPCVGQALSALPILVGADGVVRLFLPGTARAGS
ncbi:MAG TPA: Rieske 2Fe-2S domain-containing protein [Alphaproteobacteria bacterium]|nr:Rieske 2Fe-2S domain-containing protein [Alphaproteobacteria bacterium]